jgi:outer membrane protein
MRKIKIIAAASAIIIIFSGISYSDEQGRENSEPVRAITFQEYSDLIQKRIPGFENNRLAVKKAENDVKKAGSISDVHITASGGIFSRKEYLLYTAFDMDYTKGYMLNAGAEKVFTSTGTRVYTGIGYTASEMRGSTGPLEKEVVSYQPVVVVSVKQPVLNNFFGYADRYAERDSSTKLEIAKLRETENNRALLTYYQKLYLEWAACLSIIEILDESVKNAEKLEAQTRRKMAAGLADNDDYQKVRGSVLIYKSQKSSFESGLAAIEKELINAAGTENITPDMDFIESGFKEAASSAMAMHPFNESRGGKILIKTTENLRLSKDVMENMALPSLNITGSLAQKTNSDESGIDVTGLTDRDYYAGFEFSYPLGNNRAESLVHESDISLKQLMKEYENAEMNYRNSLFAVINAIDGNRKLLEIKEQNMAALRSRYYTEKKKYSQARLDLRYLIETEHSMASERIEILNTKKSITGLRLDYIYLTE